VLEQFCHLFPNSDIYALVASKEKLSETIRRQPIHVSPLGKVPFATQRYKPLLPFHPMAIASTQMDARTKLAICSDAAMIKGIRIGEDAKLVCYCHSPPRYLWEMQDSYKRQSSGMGRLGSFVFDAVVPYCRRFDFKAAQRVNLFIANSKFVQARIKNYYHKDSIVINPPVDVESFHHLNDRGDFYLVISELVPYKRIDIAVDAFNACGKKLVIIGDGSERKRLEARAKSNVTFLGRQPFNVLRDHYQTCRAFVFPGVEDFGITPVEAQAAGSPVIAFNQGGALETVVSGQTGFFFDEQSVDSLIQAISDFENRGTAAIAPEACRANAEKYHPSIFRQRILESLRPYLKEIGHEVPPA
jgi:glycosyltransferase involved in cell wall biosynthesis